MAAESKPLSKCWFASTFPDSQHRILALNSYANSIAANPEPKKIIKGSLLTKAMVASKPPERKRDIVIASETEAQILQN